MSRRVLLLGGIALAPYAARAQATTYTLLGDATSVETMPAGALVRADRGTMLVEVIAGVGVRVRVRIRNGDGAGAGFGPIHSLATNDAPALGTATVRETTDTIFVTGEGLVAAIARKPVRVSVRDAGGRTLVRESFGAAALRGRLAHYVRDESGTRYFGLGEQPAGLRRNGEAYAFWNTDRFAYNPGQTIYSTFPFYVAIRDGAAHGVLYDDPFRGEMEFANRLPGSIGYTADGGPDGGELRWYAIGGPGLDSVLARYSRLTGRLPMPPRWALGYQQSRYTYAPDSVLTNVATEMRRRDIPGDALYLDIDFMRGFRVFTWSPTGYPHPKATLDSLRTLGFRVVAIVDPGVKRDSAFDVYRDLVARRGYVTLPDGSPALGKVWPDTAIYPDFTRAAVRAWWGAQQSALLDVGVAGIWNDMNEPASFLGGTLSELAQFDGDGRPGSHAEYHNQYGTLMARASYDGLRALRPDRRPFVITRAGYTGVQRWSTMWTGDNQSTWLHLKLSIPMLLSLGLSGQPFAGSDVGGFAGAPSGELYARWMQAATLAPLFRTHSAIDTPRREPWSLGADVERANRATIRLRYRLVPLLYTAFHQHASDGAPVLRPLFWHALDDTTAMNVSDELLVGDHLLAAPVVDSAVDARSVYLPRGRWYRLGSDSAYDGGTRVTVPAPRPGRDATDSTGLGALPLFARAGAVIPMQPVMLFDGARRVDTLALHVYPGAATSELYEDAGDGFEYERGQYRRTRFTTTSGGGRTTLALAREGAFAGARSFSIVLHGAARPRRVRVDGRDARWSYDASARTALLVVPSSVRSIVVQDR